MRSKWLSAGSPFARFLPLTGLFWVEWGSLPTAADLAAGSSALAPSSSPPFHGSPERSKQTLEYSSPPSHPLCPTPIPLEYL